VITGASNVSNAMGYGKKAARNMDKALMGFRRWERLFPDFEYDDSPPAPNEERRQHTGELPAKERVLHFEEVSVGFSAAMAEKEASRCLRCDIRRGH
jgi:NADH-quinone oxidoreductase subunit F